MSIKEGCKSFKNESKIFKMFVNFKIWNWQWYANQNFQNILLHYICLCGQHISKNWPIWSFSENRLWAISMPKWSEHPLSQTMSTITTTSGPLLDKTCCSLPNQTIVQIMDGPTNLPPHCDEFITYMDLWTLLQRL